MNNTQLPFLVEGILILVAMTFGILLDRKGKPFGKVKLVIHLFFVAWFATGYGFIIYGLLTITPVTKMVWIPVAVMGLAILTQLVTGILTLAFKTVKKPLTTTHLTSAIVMIVSDICAFFIAGIR